MKTLTPHFWIALTLTLPCWVGCLHVPIEREIAAVHRQVERRTRAVMEGVDHTAVPASLSSRMREMLKDDLTLEEAVRISLVNNGHLLAQYEQLHIATAEWLQMRLLPNPGAEGLVLISEHDSDRRIWELGSSWNVMEVMLLPLDRRLADDRLTIAELETTMQTMAHIYRVRDTYRRLQAAKQQYDLMQTFSKSAAASYEMAQRLREAGNIKELDVLNERALYEQTKIDLSAAEFDVARLREALNVLLGLWGENTNWQIPAELPEVPEDDLDPETLEKQAITSSLDLAIGRSRIQAAARQLGIERVKSVIPQLHMGVDAEREPDDTWFIGPRIAMELPVFDFGQARRPMMKAKMQRRWRQYAALAVEIRAAVRTAYERASLARQRAVYYRDVLVPLQERIMHRTQLQYNAMQFGVFHLLQAKRMELAVRRRYIGELRNYWLARNDLEQLLNGRFQGGRAMEFSLPETGMVGGDNGGH